MRFDWSSRAKRDEVPRKMPIDTMNSLFRWAGAASIAALGLAVFLLFAPPEPRAERARPSGDASESALATIATAAAPGTRDGSAAR
ncbi:MAG: hypothetical protein KJZ83_16565 [Burkholderiaceae bacterium]|nr:hypothetical protein [Burkholderiaceae bacterium]